jgi:ketosteroid isomerase-like protein
MRAERERRLADIYDAANRGDFDALVECLDPQVEWRTPSRTIRGRNAVAGWLTGWHTSYHPRHRVERFIHAGDEVVALVRIDYERREANAPAHVWRFEGERVTRVRIYPVREVALEELGLER